MDVGTVPAQAPEGGFRGRSMTLPREAPDGDLVALIRAGNGSAFAIVDARYRSAILGFCRHLLSDRDEAEDAVQHTFMAAYTSILDSDQEIDLRPWLYAIARNRCYTILRSRREVSVAEFDLGMSEEPDALVQRREDLRDLVLDVSRLPDDQRRVLRVDDGGAPRHRQDEVGQERAKREERETRRRDDDRSLGLPNQRVVLEGASVGVEGAPILQGDRVVSALRVGKLDALPHAQEPAARISAGRQGRGGRHAPSLGGGAGPA